jgi:hypothetical protein
MKRLIIDDIRVFDFEADYCRTVGDFRDMYDDWDSRDTWPAYDECWLDNDMGYNPHTLELEEEVKILVNEIEEHAAEGMLLPIKAFVIHTSNYYAGAQMYEALHKYYPTRIERDVVRYLKGYAR